MHDQQENGSRGNWYRNSANRAEKYLESTPPDKLGPAGKILKRSRPQLTSERSRPGLEGIDGGASERSGGTQLPLMGSVPNGEKGKVR